MNTGTEDLSVSAQAAQAVSQILMSPHMEETFFRQQSLSYLDKIATSLPVHTNLGLSVKPKPLDLPKLVTAHFASDPHMLSPESLTISPDSWQESLASISMVAHEQADFLGTSFLHAPGQPTGESLSVSESCLEEVSPMLSPTNPWSTMPCFASQTALWVEQNSGQINSHVQPYPESPLAGNADTSHASHPAKSPLLSRKTKKSAAKAKSPRKRQTLSVLQKRVLYGFMVAHMDNPYPNDDERLNELNVDGLSKQRFKWWFSNHRHRSLELCVDSNGNKSFKPKLPFYKACRRLGVRIPWDIPHDIQAKLK
ncbi:hypothetical protein EV183_003147 [Coemansia sp. RSA 2336]|nr:hypothetical protein EV183_003147 [Coemansia sp. RSA 2336]